jgi:valyl-tRNA synthetase
LTKYLEKRKNELSEFETRIIYKTIDFQKEYEEALGKNQLHIIQKKIIAITKDDFCDKYLEIQKHTTTENSSKVTLWCLGTLLKLLYPFIPFVTQQIRELIGFE